MFEFGQKVRVRDEIKLKNDPFLDELAFHIIEQENFIGEITKVEEGIHFVGFINDDGWVTQGFKADEIEVVE